MYEKRVLTNVRLTQHQMKVLAMILASPEGIVPDEDISKGPNLTQARKILTKLGLITHDGDNKYSVSDTGQAVAKDENIVDDTGQLTELGNQLATGDQEDAPEMGNPEATPSLDEPPAPDAFAQTSNEIGMPGPSESFRMINKLLSEEKKTFLVTYRLSGVGVRTGEYVAKSAESAERLARAEMPGADITIVEPKS
jgi:hypothetical protein